LRLLIYRSHSHFLSFSHFFFTDPATTHISTLSLHDALPIFIPCVIDLLNIEPSMLHHYAAYGFWAPSIGNYTAFRIMDWNGTPEDRKSTRLNSSHRTISYAVFCLKKKNKKNT